MCGQRLNARSNVHAVAVNITVATHHVADVNANADFNLPIGRYIMIALRQRTLNFHRAVCRIECAGKFHHECVANRFNLLATKPREQRPKNLAMLL